MSHSFSTVAKQQPQLARAKQHFSPQKPKKDDCSLFSYITYQSYHMCGLRRGKRRGINWGIKGATKYFRAVGWCPCSDSSSFGLGDPKRLPISYSRTSPPLIWHLDLNLKVVEEPGFEPGTFRMRSGHSTTELHPLC